MGGSRNGATAQHGNVTGIEEGANPVVCDD